VFASSARMTMMSDGTNAPDRRISPAGSTVSTIAPDEADAAAEKAALMDDAHRSTTSQARPSGRK
jgi:hypothetical protein